MQNTSMGIRLNGEAIRHTSAVCNIFIASISIDFESGQDARLNRFVIDINDRFCARANDQWRPVSVSRMLVPAQLSRWSFFMTALIVLHFS